jgi:hypothetical protein
VTAAGAPAIHLRVGHSVFLPGFYLPLQLYFFFTACKTSKWKYVLLSAATLALMVFNGGTHILPMSIAAIGCFAVIAAIARRDWRPITFAAAFGVAGLAYSAPKLLPVVEYVNGEYFWDTRNPTEHPDRVTLDILKQTYLVPTQDVRERLPMQRHGWHEYGNYIGLGSAIALIAGVIVVFVRRASQDHWFGVALGITTLFLFLLSVGEFAPYAPASLAHYVPLFSSFRIPSRYTIPFLQFGALTLAWAYQSISVNYRVPQAARVVIGAIAVIASAHLILTNRVNLEKVFTLAPFDTTFTWNGGSRQISTDGDSSAYTPDSPMLRALMADRAFFNCYESLQLSRGAVATKPLVFDSNPSERVSDVDFSPNQLTFTVKDGVDPARVVLNQNWGPGWSTTAGTLNVPAKTELANVIVPPGQTGRYTFTFVPPGFYAGIGAFAVAAIATALLWRKNVRAIF